MFYIGVSGGALFLHRFSHMPIYCWPLTCCVNVSYILTAQVDLLTGGDLGRAHYKAMLTACDVITVLEQPSGQVVGLSLSLLKNTQNY